VAGKVLARLTALVALVSVAALAGVGGTQPAGAGLFGCGGQVTVQPFTPWLDPANYVLLTNGSLESTAGWTLSGGAKLVPGNEPWRVNAAGDSRSLSLPSGSSATSPAFCVTLLHPDLRFFAVNSGSPLSALEVDATTTVLGLRVTTPVGVLLAGGAWQPTLPLPFLDGLLSLTQGTVQFRFTPIGADSGWQIDDIYVDPFKSR
jgi:hypothetical protein